MGLLPAAQATPLQSWPHFGASGLVALPPWMRRWNFIERARLERQLWDAFERGADLEALVADCRAAVEQGDGERRFQLEVWGTTLERIRRIERMMRDQQKPGS